MTKELRKYKRFTIELPAKVTLLNQEKSLSKITALNVSAEGLCIETDHPINVGNLFKLKVMLRKNDEVKFKAKVVWIDKIKNKYRMGIKIIDASRDDESRFIRFYCHKILDIVEDH